MSRLLHASFESSPATPTGWVYDSGLAAPLRTIAQNLVVAQLAPLVRPTGFLEAVEGIGFGIKGPHDEHAIDMLWNALKSRTPAIAVYVGAIHDQAAGAPNTSRGLLEVELYFISGHRRSMTEGRTTGDVVGVAPVKTNDPGLHATLELAWMFLQDANLGTKRIPPLRRKSDEELISNLEFTCWVQRYETLVTLDVNHNRAIVTKLRQLHSTLKPTGDEPNQLHITEYSNA